MSNISINRGEATQIPFSITDAASGLAGKRVTWSIGAWTTRTPYILQKVGGLPGSSASVTISSQTAGTITGTINVVVADYASLPADTYAASLWTDDGAGNDRCVTVGGVDQLTIVSDVPRS